MLTTATLANGVRLVSVRLERLAAAASFTFACGGRDEQPAEPGIGHLLEHGLLTGSRRYGSRDAIRDAVEALGGTVNAATDAETMRVYTTCLAGSLEQSLGVLADVVQHPRLETADIERERAVVREELNRLQDNAAEYLRRLIAEALWPDQPLGAAVGQQQTVLPTLTAERIRLHARRYLAPTNCVVTVVGDAGTDRSVALVEELTDGWAGEQPPRPSAARPLVVPRLRSVRRETRQLHIAIGFYAASYRDPDRYAQEIGEWLLRWRLRERLRDERGLAYTVGVSGTSYADAGDLFVHGGFRLGSGPEVLETVCAEVKRLQGDRVDMTLFARAVARLCGGLVFSTESVETICRRYGDRVSKAIDPVALEDVLARYRAATPDDVVEAMRRHLRGEPKVALIGPGSDIDAMQVALLGTRAEQSSLGVVEGALRDTEAPA